MLIRLLLGFFLLLHASVLAQYCSKTVPCAQGCCSQYNSCGFDAAHCGAGCLSNCNAKAECGAYGNATLCPLNVCCSSFGFCGTTADFCGTGCQNGCAPVDRPSCASNTNAVSYERRIGYYELFGVERPCDVMLPEGIAAGALTHINLAFALIGSNNQIIDDSGNLVARVSRLKMVNPGLRVNIAIGGWDFNDPPTQSIFTDMAASGTGRQTFIASVIQFIQKYGLDGVDIDWEYPVAPDRGGQESDFDNYPLLLAEMRAAFDAINPGWEITITLPSSYWYMRGFNLPELQKSVSWFNFMSYDLHGQWDFSNNYTGPYLLGHTNITEIDEGLDLLWRNGVQPENVVFGLAFYGRSFTMADPSCYEPGCQFSGPGLAGDCSQTPGILIYPEIQSANSTINSETYYVAQDTVKYTVFDYSQWISYDDEQSFYDKKTFLSGRCLSGVMIWAIDQDNPQYDAIIGVFGEDALNGLLLQGGDLSQGQKNKLAHDFGAYTGQDCYVTTECTNGTPGQMRSTQVCAAGYNSVSTAHSPLQIHAPDQSSTSNPYQLVGNCSPGWYRNICCPSDALPQNCEWEGGSVTPVTGLIAICPNIQCGQTQFQLAQDAYNDPLGKALCFPSPRRLCCDSTEILDQCFWTACQGPYSQQSWFTKPPLTCPSGSTYMTFRYDADDHSFCSSEIAPNAGEFQCARAYCCPNADIPTGCQWSNAITQYQNGLPVYDPYSFCHPTACPEGTVQYTTALVPPNSSSVLGISGSPGSIQDCATVTQAPGASHEFPYCCAPPTDYKNNWPVPPSYLWSNPYDDQGDDVQWAYADNFGNNNMDTTSNPSSYGDDPYGFVMLDGPPGSLDTQFSENFVFAHEAHVNTKVKRNLLTTDPKRLDAMFDHLEEVAYVYCAREIDSPHCTRIFYKSAKDTIIRLPDYFGDGPFARVVSMEPAEDHYRLPKHHLRQRSMERNLNPIYKLTIDYNFHLIKRSEEVNIRVDYTNMMPYWDVMTDSPASKLKKRLVRDHDLTEAEWKDLVRRAKVEHLRRKEKRSKVHSAKESRHEKLTKLRSMHNYVPSKLGKRWFGSFVDWLQKLNNVESSNVGYLSMLWDQSTLLYHAAIGCPSSTAFAELSIYLDANVNLEATYAYYFSGTIVPPAITGTYAYFSLDPSAYLGLTVEGFAQMQYQSARVKLIDTIAYPGLAIRGLAAIGPTLDVYGQIIGVVTLSGTMQIGFRFNFERQEWFWPDDSDSSSYMELLGLNGQPQTSQTGITPEFYGTVQAEAGLDILVTPEANMGIKIGGGSLVGTLVNAQIVGYVNNTLRFNAHAEGSIGSGGAGSYSYGYAVKFLYNIGYGAVAQIPLFPWYAKTHDLFNPPQEIVLYQKEVSSDSSKVRRELPSSKERLRLPRKGLLNSAGARELHSPVEPLAIDMNRRFGNDDMENAFDFDNTYNSTVSVDSLLRKRSVLLDGGVPDLSLAQLFQCPASASCPCKTCTSQKRDVPLANRASLASRQATAPCPSTLPDFRINCDIFSDVVAQRGAGGTASVPVIGICHNELNFFARSGAPNSGITLTYDGGGDANARKTSRGNQACGGNNCPAESVQITQQTGVQPIGVGTSAYHVSCDEFPYRSAEEGGNYPAGGSQIACCPKYQQALQGTCNGLPGYVQTNILRWDNPNNAALAQWMPWNDPRWLQAGATNFQGTVFNRLTTYMNNQPPSAGIPASPGNTLNYMFKRNFTVGFAWPKSVGATSWSANAANAYRSWAFVGPTTLASNVPQDSTSIACAINLFGQSNTYRMISSTGQPFNGYCVRSLDRNAGPFGANTPAISRCLIQWASSNGFGTKKRSIGSFGPYEIESIEMVEDDEPVMELPPEALDELNIRLDLPYKNVKAFSN